MSNFKNPCHDIDEEIHGLQGRGPDAADFEDDKIRCQICGAEESGEITIVLFDNTKALDPILPPDETEAELCEACAKGLKGDLK